jgi:hypothetical protein
MKVSQKATIPENWSRNALKLLFSSFNFDAFCAFLRPYQI